MAIGTPYTVVADDESVSTATTTFQTPVTHDVGSGDAIKVHVLNNNTAVTGVTDSQGNLYTLASSETPSGLHVYTFVALNATPLTVAGSDWIKATFGSTGTTSTNLAIIARACSGIAASAAVDSATTSAGATATSTAVDTGASGTLGQAAEWVSFVIGNSNAGGAPSGISGGFTQQVQDHPGGSPYLTICEQVTSATTPLDGSATIASAKWAAYLVGLKGVSTSSAVSLAETAAVHDSFSVTGAGGRIRRVGCALGFGGSLSGQTDRTPAQFAAIVGTNGAGHVRYGNGHFFFGGSVPASLAAAPQGLAAYVTLNGGTRATVDFELTHYGVNGTFGAGGTPAAGAVSDRNKLDTFIASCQAGGLDLRICLWHEAFSKFNVQATKDLNNLDYANSMGYYGVTLRKYGIPVYFDPSNYSAQNHFSATIGTAASPGLGWAACAAGYIDEIHTDFYVNQNGVGHQGHFDEVATLASAFNLPLGVLELGVTPADTTSWTAADADAFLSYVIGFLSDWHNNATVTLDDSTVISTTDVADIIFWGNVDGGGSWVQALPQNWTANNLTDYHTLFDTYDNGTYGGVIGTLPQLADTAAIREVITVSKLGTPQLADIQAMIDGISVSTGQPVTVSDRAAVTEELAVAVSETIALADVAAVSDGLAVVERPPPPWALTAIAPGSTTTFIASASAVTLFGITAGSQFQLYSGGQPLNTNPFFTSGTVGWSAFNGTQAVTSSPPAGCPYANADLYTNNGVTAGALEGSPAPFPVLPGQAYLVSAWVYSSVANVQIGMDWLNASLGFLSTSVVSVTVPVSTWTLITGVLTPKGPSVAFGYPRVGSSSTGETIYVAGCITVPSGLLVQGQVFTVQSVAGGTLTFSPAAAVATMAGEQALQAVTGLPAALPAATPAFIRSAMPRAYAQNLLTGEWLNRDIQNITQPQVTWNLNQPDTFTCVISPPRPDLFDSTGSEPLLKPWRDAVYLEEDNEIRFGGIVTSSSQAGPAWTLGCTGFAGYPNGMPYEGPVYKKTSIEALDVVRDLWNWLQAQPGGDIGMELALTDSGVLLGNQPDGQAVFTTLKIAAQAGDKKIVVENAAGFTKGMKISVGTGGGTNTVTAPPAGTEQPAGGHLVGEGTIYLEKSLLDGHKAGTVIAQILPLQPIELDWWNSTDIGQEIQSISQEAVFDWQESHGWQDPAKTAVRHRLAFGVPRIGGRLMAGARFAEGENIIGTPNVDEDGTTYFNNWVGLGAGQGSAQIRAQVSDLGGRLRRTQIFTDQTVRTVARIQTKIQKSLTASTNINAVTQIVVMNHPNAPFGSFGVGDDIQVILASGWRSGPIWSRIISMQQDPTTSQMTLTLARSDSFTYMAQSGQAGTI